jgi:hypothetical protein
MTPPHMCALVLPLCCSALDAPAGVFNLRTLRHLLLWRALSCHALSCHITGPLQGAELAPYMRLDTDLPGFTARAFSPDGRELLALSSDQRLERFDLASGHVLQQVEQVGAQAGWARLAGQGWLGKHIQPSPHALMHPPCLQPEL